MGRRLQTATWTCCNIFPDGAHRPSCCRLNRKRRSWLRLTTLVLYNRSTYRRRPEGWRGTLVVYVHWWFASQGWRQIVGHVEASIAIVVLKYVTECITLSVGQKKNIIETRSFNWIYHRTWCRIHFKGTSPGLTNRSTQLILCDLSVQPIDD